MAAIAVRGLTKTYGDVEAVRGIDLEVEVGEVFALLGPNGAGKSTTVEILEGHRQRTSGDIEVLGFDPHDSPRDFRESIGIVLQETAVELELTVHEAIDLYGRMYPSQLATGEVIELVGLTEKTKARIKTLSGGQRRRLELALGIVGDPKLIFLDEPTTGFDPSARRQAWSIVENLTSLGKTVLLTTHYMDEAQHLADRVAVIAKGVIVAEGTPESLGGRENLPTIIRFRSGDGVLEGIPTNAVSVDTTGYVVVRSENATADIHAISGWALDRGLELTDLSVARPSLEDVYLDLTGDEAGTS
ncbi:MAG: ABC transporter ATP-binding protein [Acidimicrobiia bacterium]|nr:ABC transporter ATP-binding protein [Acidimicrobiia bacterium]